MDSTTRWIMIILLLLLIAAAVFMLLRSPGKNDGDGKDDGGETAVGPRDTDRDGVPDAQEERIQPAGAAGGRGVYDQEADSRTGAPHDTRPLADTSRDAQRTDEVTDDRATLPAADRMDEYAHPDAVDDRDRQEEPDATPVETSRYDTAGATPAETSPYGGATTADETAEPYRPEAGAVEDGRSAAPAHDSSTGGMTDVHPLTDDEVYEGGREEPLTRDEQQPGTPPEDVATAEPGASAEERRQVVDYQQGTLYDESASGVADEGADERDDEHREYPVGEESTTYRAAGGDAVVVGDDRSTDTQGMTDDHGTADGGWDAPADAGTGGPETADDIAEGRTSTGAGLVGAAAGGGATVAPPGRDTDTDTDTGTGTGTEDATLRSTDSTDTTPPGSTSTDHPTEQDGYAPVFTEAAYGAGSAEPLDDGTGPAGWEVKGNIGSMLFHTPESPSWDAVRAEVWFESEDAARAAGFAHWDRRRR